MHTAQTLIEAAITLFARGGAREVTMAAIARMTGAPSGSVYHRFPDRPSLLSAVWRHTARDFEAGYRDQLGSDPSPDAAITVAVWCVEWCRIHPERAAVLHSGMRAFSPETWSADQIAANQAEECARDREFATVVAAIAERSGHRRDEVAFAMLGLPLAIVGSHLQSGDSVPHRASDLVRRIASRLLLS
ncbi:TetR family transcriptional regulator [Hoyosella subflava DQS3-9A1]|uniref:TetR family transcriptional regulator n=1 Tax=Hoyosella subflava (strain DSM 45089 / JCM 17490 / NBRC 109087 / DQS3-9A1) TaxID=443218 RepID=F6ENU9_HOYSD|nr:TetR family transcriptional regulator [Hoyosella subflava DQS3-9A1]